MEKSVVCGRVNCRLQSYHVSAGECKEGFCEGFYDKMWGGLIIHPTFHLLIFYIRPYTGLNSDKEM